MSERAKTSLRESLADQDAGQSPIHCETDYKQRNGQTTRHNMQAWLGLVTFLVFAQATSLQIAEDEE